MKTAIVDYGSGNLHSARKAFERVVAENALRQEIVVTDDPAIVAGADRIVLPGVGAFADCRRGLFAVAGMVEALSEAVITRARPFLGICVGMQLMASRGLEHETSAGLDWIAGDVARIEPAKAEFKVPHMGWNSLRFERPHTLFAEFAGATPFAYFVHSYHFSPKSPEHRLASSDHGGAFSAIIGRDNLVGTQFHPEKSQAFGLAFIRAFLSWRP